jgi:D-xylose transport system substrate-binding protein
MDEVEGTVKFSGGPKGVEMNSYFIAPLPGV